MRVIFQADDGQYFENVEDCLEYERTLKKSYIQRCWDAEGNELVEAEFDQSFFCVQTENAPDYDMLPSREGCWVWFGEKWIEAEGLGRKCLDLEKFLSPKVEEE